MGKSMPYPEKSKEKSFLLISLGYSDGSSIEEETSYIQLGILYLATVLKNNNYRVKVLFKDYPDPDLIIEKIKEENAFLAGFYSTTENIYRTLKCINFIKKSFPELIIILGGPHGTVTDKELMEKEKNIDIIVRNEGEETILDLAKFFIDRNGNLDGIKGITYREKDLIIRNPDRPFIENLDSLPIPDRDLLYEPIKTFDKLYPRIITGRGCPFKCAFCYEGMSGNKYRMRSAENVIEEIDYILERGEIRYIRFLDDTFTVNPRRTMKICNALRERSKEGKNFMWFAEGRVDVLSKNPRLLYAMSLSGIANIQLGVECADQKILDLYEKNITLRQIEEVVYLCSQALIPSISINFILGGPFESKETIKKNLEFIEKLMKIAPGRLNVSSSLLVPFPGTAISRNPEKYGLNIIDPDCITGMTNETCYCETEYLDRYELTNIKRNFSREIEKMMINISKEVPYHTVSQNFSLQFFGLSTPWYILFSRDIGIKRYFNLKLHGANLSLSEIPSEQIDSFYPTRTYNLNYNEKDLVILDKVYGKEILNNEESRIYELSSGKRTFNDIVKIAGEKIFKDLSERDLMEKVMNTYIRLESLHSIIFAKI